MSKLTTEALKAMDEVELVFVEWRRRRVELSNDAAAALTAATLGHFGRLDVYKITDD